VTFFKLCGNVMNRKIKIHNFLTLLKFQNLFNLVNVFNKKLSTFWIYLILKCIKNLFLCVSYIFPKFDRSCNIPYDTPKSYFHPMKCFLVIIQVLLSIYIGPITTKGCNLGHYAIHSFFTRFWLCIEYYDFENCLQYFFGSYVIMMLWKFRWTLRI